MMTDTAELSLEIEHRISAAPDRVFDAWLDPAMLAKFMTPMPGMTVPKASNDPKVGGRFAITMHETSMGDMLHEGEYLEIDRPNRLQFTWASFNSQEDSTVTLDFTPDGDGTLVKLHHLRFPSEKSRDDHRGGWTHILESLNAAL